MEPKLHCREEGQAVTLQYNPVQSFTEQSLQSTITSQYNNFRIQSLHSTFTSQYNPTHSLALAAL